MAGAHLMPSDKSWQRFPAKAWAAEREYIVPPWPRALIEHDLRFWEDEVAHFGAKMPTVRALAKTWGVPKSTVHDAMQRAVRIRTTPGQTPDTRSPSNADNREASGQHPDTTRTDPLKEKGVPSVSGALRSKKEEVGQNPPLPTPGGGDQEQVLHLKALLLELEPGPVFDRYESAEPACIDKVFGILKARKQGGTYHGSLRYRTVAASLREAARQIREERP